MGCQSSGGGDGWNYNMCFNPGANPAVSQSQNYGCGFLGASTCTRTNTLGRSMSWVGGPSGGYYSFTGGDACGPAPRAGRVFPVCGTGTGLTIQESTLYTSSGAVSCNNCCNYTLRYTTPSACATAGTLKAPNGLCMDVSNSGKTAGTAVQLYACNNSPAQLWAPMPPGGTGTLINPASGLCLDIAGGSTAAGAKLQLFTCNGSNAQKWALPPVNGGVVTLTSGLSSSICVDTSTGQGVQLQTLNPCTSGQVFTFTKPT
jgi:hypothetical protein